MPKPSKDPAQWLPEARSGSPEALGQVLQACRHYLLRIAQHELDADLLAKVGASELVQQTFLEAQKGFGQFQGDSEKELLAWLRCLLLHNVADLKRNYRNTDKRQVSREVALESGHGSSTGDNGLAAGTPSPSAQAMANEDADALQRALDQLPDDYRQVIRWRHQEARSFEEIGQLMDRSADAARKLWTRAIHCLQQAWETHHEP